MGYCTGIAVSGTSIDQMAGKLRAFIQVTATTLVVLAATELICRFVEGRMDRVPKRAPTNEEPSKPPSSLPPKGASEVRVFLFGGSSVYGVPVPEVAFAAQMRYWLHRLYPDRDVKIYNFGWGGVDSQYGLHEFQTRLDAEPDLTIVITGHNEFLTRDSNEQLDSIRSKLARHLSAMRLVERSVTKKAQSERNNVMPSQILPWDRRSASFRQRIATFEQSVKAIVSAAQQRNAPLILGTLPSNISDWPPVHQ